MKKYKNKYEKTKTLKVNENNDIDSIIEIFQRFGNKYNDISRVIHRCPEIKEDIISSYESFENGEICRNTLDREIDTWQKIDTGYINYMKSVGIC